jgi:hypothetical protein
MLLIHVLLSPLITNRDLLTLVLLCESSQLYMAVLGEANKSAPRKSENESPIHASVNLPRQIFVKI